VHSTAGLIDPGFDGCITLEMSNVGPLALVLCPTDLIGQLTLDYTTSPVIRPYGSPGLGSHYQGQTGTTAARSAA
jgi:dCTP deaminase